MIQTTVHKFYQSILTGIQNTTFLVLERHADAANDKKTAIDKLNSTDRAVLGLDKSRSVWFWIKEYCLRIRHLSVLTNVTAYNEKADQLLNECLDFADVHEIREFVVRLRHPGGSVHEFWITNWCYAYGHRHLRGYGYRGLDVYYTTRYRLKKFLETVELPHLTTDTVL